MLLAVLLLVSTTTGLIATPAAVTVALAAKAERPEKRRVLVLDLRSDGAKPEHARLVTDNVVVALSRFSQLEVVSSEDVRRMVQTEGEKQAVGCTDDSCLTEIASAMGASLVVHGSIGKLESLTIVNLSLYDSKAGKSIGRESIRVQRLDDLPYMVEDATARLVRPLLGEALAETPMAAPAGAGAPAAPGSDLPKTNRVLAGGVAAGTTCCVGGAVFALAGFVVSSLCGGGLCPMCVAGGCAAALAGGAGPVVGTLIGGAPVKSMILPVVIGSLAGGVIGFGAASIVAFTVADPLAPAAFAVPSLIAAVPVGLLAGATVAIATGLLLDDPEPPEATTATPEEAKLRDAPKGRYAMAF
jgi:TolB-like protein